MQKETLFKNLETIIAKQKKSKSKPFRVAINGIEGSGKTEFTIGLTAYLNHSGHTAIHVPIDGFHNSREIRYRQGTESAVGYYEDAYNETVFVQKVLQSSQSECPQITMAVHDLDADSELAIKPVPIPANTVIITDGSYLFKLIYRKFWDLKMYLKTDFETAMDRGIRRDTDFLGDKQNAEKRYRLRYHAASKIYIREINPESISEIVIDNTDFEFPILLKTVEE